MNEKNKETKKDIRERKNGREKESWERNKQTNVKKKCVKERWKELYESMKETKNETKKDIRERKNVRKKESWETNKQTNECEKEMCERKRERII